MKLSVKNIILLLTLFLNEQRKVAGILGYELNLIINPTIKYAGRDE